MVWLSGLSTTLWTKSPVWLPVRAQAWVEGQVPTWGRVRGNWSMFLSLSFSPSLLLSLKIKSFKNTYFPMLLNIFKIQGPAEGRLAWAWLVGTWASHARWTALWTFPLKRHTGAWVWHCSVTEWRAYDFVIKSDVIGAGPCILAATC